MYSRVKVKPFCQLNCLPRVWLIGQLLIDSAHPLHLLQFPKYSGQYDLCRSAHPQYHGYPCGLWILFHALTVSHYENELAGVSKFCVDFAVALCTIVLDGFQFLTHTSFCSLRALPPLFSFFLGVDFIESIPIYRF